MMVVHRMFGSGKAGKRRRQRQGELTLALGYAGLLLLGIAAAIVFYGSVLTAAQIVAADSGSSLEDRTRINMALCLGFLVAGALPLVRFSVTELPQLVLERVQVSGRSVLLGGVLVVSIAVLLLA